jgi:ABC-type transport system involved in multi-copper enzyme maturation permease subunit
VLQTGYGFQWWRILYFLGFIAVFLTLTFFRYRKKDILI